MKPRLKTCRLWTVSREELQTFVDESSCFLDVLRKLGLSAKGNYSKQLQQRLMNEQIDVSALVQRRCNIRKNSNFESRKPLEEIFIVDQTVSRSLVKARVREFNLIPYRCAECGIEGCYNNKPLTLQLDHINGVNYDNRLENLRFLCPNCHAQTDTFGAKRRKGTGKKTKTYGVGRRYNRLSKRKVVWPGRDELNKMLWEMTTEQIAKNYGVTGNAVAKWARKYELEKPTRGYWQKKNAGII